MFPSIVVKRSVTMRNIIYGVLVSKEMFQGSVFFLFADGNLFLESAYFVCRSENAIISSSVIQRY